jgi:hypothetical protein
LSSLKRFEEAPVTLRQTLCDPFNFLRSLTTNRSISIYQNGTSNSPKRRI